MDYARIAQKLREQMARFSGELSSGFPKVVRRFLEEMIYGIQARQSVRLTEVARALGGRTSLKKSEERLSRQIGRSWLWEAVTERLIRLGSRTVERETLLILDLSDLCKKYARKMEYLARVRDGSEKTLGQGYWMVNVIGADLGRRGILPLYGRLYSHRAPDHRSENVEIERAMGMVSAKSEGRGVWVLDRGGDRIQLYRYLLDKKLRFLNRIDGDRSLETEEGMKSALEAAQGTPILYVEHRPRFLQGEAKLQRLEIGFRRVRLPGRKEVLTLVVVRGLGQEPLMLLTNLVVLKSRKSVLRVMEAYFLRWRVEETIRFLKQSYQLEDIRLLTYRRLQNMMALVMAVIYFAAIYLGVRLKLRVLARHVLSAARRVFNIPDFRLYALADGIKHCLYSRARGAARYGPDSNPPIPSLHLQLGLFDS
ncbi:MAG: transposase [Candidatus Aminicenantales bacterium]